MKSTVSCHVLIHQNSALHVAAREGHTAAVKLLMNRGAELSLNKTETSFLHEAVQNGRKDVVNAVIDSDRYIIIATCLLQIKVNFYLAGVFYPLHA